MATVTKPWKPLQYKRHSHNNVERLGKKCAAKVHILNLNILALRDYEKHGWIRNRSPGYHFILQISRNKGTYKFATGLIARIDSPNKLCAILGVSCEPR